MFHRIMSSARGEVHYWLLGEGVQTIVFTHGATMDHRLFDLQVRFFSPRFRVINWDMPLHGLSRPYRAFSLSNAADELIAILDAERIDRAHLVGQSMGGYVSQIAAASFPKRVRSITVVGSSPVQLAYYSVLDRWLLSLTPALLQLFPYHMLIHIIANQIAVTGAARAYAFEVLSTYTKPEITRIMGAAYRGLLSSGEERLPCPILITYGTKDTTGKVRSYCDRWARREGRELRIIPGAAHNANMDNADVFNRDLIDFLGRTAALEGCFPGD